MGRGVLRHDQHRASTCSTRRLRLHPRGRGRRLLRRRVPGGARPAAAALGHVVDGYWEDVGTLESYRTAHEDILDGRVDIEMPGFHCATACGSARASTSRPTRSSRARCSSATTRRVEAGAVLASVHGARRRRRREGRRRSSSGRSCTTTSTSATGARVRGAVIGRANDIRDSVHIEEGVVDRRRVLRRRRSDHQPGGEDLPVQDGRGGRARHVVDRVGEQGRPHAVRPPRRARPRQRRHHLRGRGPARDGVRHRAQEGLGRVHEPRHEPRRRARSSGRSSPAST